MLRKFFFIFFNLFSCTQETSYWIWSGIDPSQAPCHSQLYLYQGNISVRRSSFHFVKKGLYPHPLKAKHIFLTYRVEKDSLDIQNIIKLFLLHAEQWEYHHVRVQGLQLDYDAPTAQLENYALALSQLHALLPTQYKLSITGLADWAYAKASSLKLLHANVDEVVYQLYQVNSYIAHVEKYIFLLERHQREYKVGLLEGHLPFDLKQTRYLKGIIYFVRKKHV